MASEPAFVEVVGTRTPITTGHTIADVLKETGGADLWGDNPVVLAEIDGRRASLAEPLWGEEHVELIRMDDPEAHSTLVRSLCFVLAAAAEELFPASELVIDFSYSGGIYCQLRREQPLSAEEIAGLEARMRQIVDRDLQLQPRTHGMRELLRLLDREGRLEAFGAVRYVRREKLSLFRMEGTRHIFYGLQVPSTGKVGAFALRPQTPGFVLIPSRAGKPRELADFKEQPKLLEAMRSYSDWLDQIGLHDVGQVNRRVVEGRAAELIQVCEARHDQIIVHTAERVAGLPAAGRLVLIAGPSSSGKTTLAKRLMIQLRVLGFRPRALSMDDYFVDRERTPRGPDGDYDYESLRAIDLELFNDHLRRLLAGESVRLASYDFRTGRNSLLGEEMTLGVGQPLIVEGMHALNPELTPAIERERKLHVYASALAHLNVDVYSYIPTTLTRLFRRIVRDAQFRGYTASQTLARWPKVRLGEEAHVFPHQQNADVFVNSALAYELGVLKLWAEPRLAAVEPDDPNYGRARSLIDLLTLLLPVDARMVPPTSLLREFIGQSGFHY